MKTIAISENETTLAPLGTKVKGKVAVSVPFGFWADVGLNRQAFVDLRYIPIKGKPRIPQPGERIEGVIIRYVEDEPRLSMLPEHIKNPPI
ncbi:MAG TPA: hypothetical protein VKX17_25845 [Planctomycetota bacterium]|nr:hypothetical protein [Planctomycetota bacterium]